MPSPWHDTVGDLIEERPEFAVEILRDLLGEDLAPGLPARIGPTVFNTRTSQDLIADKVVLAGPTWDVSRVIIIEAQQKQEDSKLLKLPMYAAAAWLRYRCPADVLVICPDQGTATWYGRPVTTGMGGSIFRARILFPGKVPVITDPAQVVADPEMAVLSVAFHGTDEGVADAFVGGIGVLGGERAAQYYEYGFSMSSEGVRGILRSLMATTRWPVYSPFAKEHYGRGRIEEARNTVLMVLKARGLDVTEPQRKRVADCADLDQLKKWSEAALTATSADDLFQ